MDRWGASEAILNAVSGQFIVAGTTVSLVVDRTLPVADGDYELAGQAVGLFRDAIIQPGRGALEIDGTALRF